MGPASTRIPMGGRISPCRPSLLKSTNQNQFPTRRNSSTDSRRFAGLAKSFASHFPRDTVIQSMPDVSPTRWHLAHATWFFETFVIANAVQGYKTFHPAYGYLFNSYYNAVGPQYPRPKRGLLSRPTLKEILEYRRHMDDVVHEVVSSGLESSLLSALEIGVQHERQHQELSSRILNTCCLVIHCYPFIIQCTFRATTIRGFWSGVTSSRSPNRPTDQGRVKKPMNLRAYA